MHVCLYENMDFINSTALRYCAYNCYLQMLIRHQIADDIDISSHCYINILGRKGREGG